MIVKNKFRIVIFASGSGSNAECIVSYFSNHDRIKVACILTNKADAFVLEKAKKLKVETKIFIEEELEGEVLAFLKKESDFIILAGFLLKIPKSIVNFFSNRIVNIHPSLLPDYGGKGMYGMHVHRAVKRDKIHKTGITIHYVDENYDQGLIIFQKEVLLSSDDTVEEIAYKVHLLERAYFPKVIEEVIDKSIENEYS